MMMTWQWLLNLKIWNVNSAFSNQFASYLLKLLSGIIAFKILHNNTSKNVEDAAADDDVSDDGADVGVDIDAPALTISLVLISSH